MLSNCKFFIIMLLVACFFYTPADAARSKVKGDPMLLWLSPLGKGDIKNNAYNRCLLIKAIKPGLSEGSKAQRNAYDVLSTYASNLYAQSLKISAHIEEENESKAKKPKADDEKKLAEKITRTMADITRRLNIINSLEAGGIMVESLMEIRGMDFVYDTFPVVIDGEYKYVSDCEVLK